jgi:hypothetical protein
MEEEWADTDDSDGEAEAGEALAKSTEAQATTVTRIPELKGEQVVEAATQPDGGGGGGDAAAAVGSTASATPSASACRGPITTSAATAHTTTAHTSPPHTPPVPPPLAGTPPPPPVTQQQHPYATSAYWGKTFSPACALMFKLADKDGDGRLNAHELAGHMAAASGVDVAVLNEHVQVGAELEGLIGGKEYTELCHLLRILPSNGLAVADLYAVRCCSFLVCQHFVLDWVVRVRGVGLTGAAGVRGCTKHTISTHTTHHSYHKHHTPHYFHQHHCIYESSGFWAR